MCKEWDGLIVCPACLDPRPPEMSPPNIYPEGLSLPDARRPPEQSAVAGAFDFVGPRSALFFFTTPGGLPFPFTGAVFSE